MGIGADSSYVANVKYLGCFHPDVGDDLQQSLVGGIGSYSSNFRSSFDGWEDPKLTSTTGFRTQNLQMSEAVGLENQCYVNSATQERAKLIVTYVKKQYVQEIVIMSRNGYSEDYQSQRVQKIQIRYNDELGLSRLYTLGGTSTFGVFTDNDGLTEKRITIEKPFWAKQVSIELLAVKVTTFPENQFGCWDQVGRFEIVVKGLKVGTSTTTSKVQDCILQAFAQRYLSYNVGTKVCSYSSYYIGSFGKSSTCDNADSNSVQVYSTSGIPEYKQIGCYHDFARLTWTNSTDTQTSQDFDLNQNQPIKIGSYQTLDSCLNEGVSKAHQYTSIVNSLMCKSSNSAVNKYGFPLASDSCELTRCTQTSEFCGGYRAQITFAKNWFFENKGCSKSYFSEDDFLGDVTNSRECFLKAFERNMRYYGLSEGKKCYANDVYQYPFGTEEGCNKRCSYQYGVTQEEEGAGEVCGGEEGSGKITAYEILNQIFVNGNYLALRIPKIEDTHLFLIGNRKQSETVNVNFVSDQINLVKLNDSTLSVAVKTCIITPLKEVEALTFLTEEKSKVQMFSLEEITKMFSFQYDLCTGAYSIRVLNKHKNETQLTGIYAENNTIYYDATRFGDLMEVYVEITQNTFYNSFKLLTEIVKCSEDGKIFSLTMFENFDDQVLIDQNNIWKMCPELNCVQKGNCENVRFKVYDKGEMEVKRTEGLVYSNETAVLGQVNKEISKQSFSIYVSLGSIDTSFEIHYEAIPRPNLAPVVSLDTITYFIIDSSEKNNMNFTAVQFAVIDFEGDQIFLLTEKDFDEKLPFLDVKVTNEFIFFDVSRAKSPGRYSFRFQLQDDQGYVSEVYSFKFDIYLAQSTTKYWVNITEEAPEEEPPVVNQTIGEPVLIKIQSINENGIVILSFNQKLLKPEPLQLLLSDKRLLEEDTQSLLDAFINKAINVTYVQYQVAMEIVYVVKFKDWRDQELEIFIEFEDPLLVSLGTYKDKLEVVINEVEHFVSEVNNITYGQLSDVEVIVEQIPRQLPHGVNAEQLTEKAAQGAKSALWIIIFTIILQVILKSRLEKFIELYLSIQLMQSISLYSVNLPANMVIYLREIRNVIEFKQLKPQFLLSLTNIDPEKIKKYFGSEQPNLPSNLEDSGLKSSNFLQNQGQTMVLYGVVQVSLIISLPFLLVKKYKQKILDKLRETKKKMIWNGLILTFTIDYLNLCKYLYTYQYIEIYYQESQILRKENEQKAYWILGALIFYPIIVSFILYYNGDEYLESTQSRERFGRLYNEVFVWKSKFIYQLFLLERLFFCLIPLYFTNHISFQLFCLINLKLMTLSYRLNSRPWNVFQNIVNLRMFAEFLHLVMFTLLFCLTDLVTDLMVRYHIGSVILFILFANLMVHFLIIMSGFIRDSKKFMQLYNLYFIKKFYLVYINPPIIDLDFDEIEIQNLNSVQELKDVIEKIVRYQHKYVLDNLGGKLSKIQSYKLTEEWQNKKFMAMHKLQVTCMSQQIRYDHEHFTALEKDFTKCQEQELVAITVNEIKAEENAGFSSDSSSSSEEAKQCVTVNDIPPAKNDNPKEKENHSTARENPTALKKAKSVVSKTDNHIAPPQSLNDIEIEQSPRLVQVKIKKKKTKKTKKKKKVITVPESNLNLIEVKTKKFKKFTAFTKYDTIERPLWSRCKVRKDYYYTPTFPKGQYFEEIPHHEQEYLVMNFLTLDF